MKDISLEERLENGIRHQPERYITVRDENKKLTEVQDRNTGRLWKKIKDSWIWLE